MADSWAIIIAAAIPVVGTGVGFLIREFKNFRVENRQDHANVMSELRKVRSGIDAVAGRLNTHIDWHMDKEKK
jgi:uncharacterized membrane-anchored protein YhcB (DUF1043 family)